MTNIFIYGFPAPISTNCKITNILLQYKIKQDTGWTIKNGEIHYIIGKIWNNETLEFEPGRGATITIEEAITEKDINIINNTKDNTRDIYAIKYYLDDKINDKTFEQDHDICKSHEQHHRNYNNDATWQEVKYIPPSERHTYSRASQKSHCNDNWYKNDFEHTITFNRYTIQKSILNKNTTNKSKSLQPKHSKITCNKYIPPPLRSKLNKTTSPHPDNQNIINKYDKTLGPNKLANSKERAHSSKISNDPITPIKTPKSIPNNNNNITNTDKNENTSLPSHPDGKKLNIKSGKTLNDNKDEPVLLHPNPTTALTSLKVSNDNNTIDHTDESPLETSTQYTIGKKLNENNNSSKIYPQTRTYQIPQIRKCTQFETENKYGKGSPSTTTNDINGSKIETAHYTIPSGTIFKAILDNKTRGETLNIENKINEESVLSHPNDKKLTEKFKKKLGNDKKSYSPSPIEETPHSNLIHTETHSNIPHKTAAIPNSNNPITQNNYAIMRALTHYIYYFLCIIIYLLSIILSTLSYMNNKILARATHGALVSRPNGEKLIEKQNPSLADIKVTLTPNLYLLNGKNENIFNNTFISFLLTLIITPLISFHSQ